MNNNQRRRLERRRRVRAALSARGERTAAAPLSVPPAAGTLCAVCAARPAEITGELAVTGHAETFRFPRCPPLP